MIDLSNFFQFGPLPIERIYGHYNFSLVILSYIIALLASYIALDFAGRLKFEPLQKTKWSWLIGGALSMGAGIWSMHFIGMEAFIMSMPMRYSIFWTIASLVVAMFSAGFALFFLRNETSNVLYLAVGGVILGLGIASMHYIGMAGMLDMHIRYLPGLFILSIVIAIVASEIAFWFIVKSNKGPFKKQIRFKVISAVVMGAAICGMHYVGMAAAIFIPLHEQMMVKSIDPFTLSLYIACVTGAILVISLIISTYKQQMINVVRNEKNFLNAVLNNLSDGVWACDQNCKTIVVNPAFKRLISLRESNYLNENLIDYFSVYLTRNNEPVPLDERPINRALRGEKFKDVELEIQLKNTKEWRNVLVSGQPLLTMDENGEQFGAVVTMNDITLQKQAMLKLESINQELDAFTHSVAHDLKAPVRAISGFSKILLDDYAEKLDEEGLRNIDIICRNTKKMAQLIDGLLAFSRIGGYEIKKEELNMYEIVKGVYAELIATIPNQEIKFELKPLPSMLGDRILIQQVFVNLISNAIKFTHNTKNPHIEVGSMVDEKNVVTYYVRDNGLGFDMQYADKLFGVFQRLHSQDIEGTGIGLANVKRIITRHGGTVYGEGMLGYGATFYFTCPKE